MSDDILEIVELTAVRELVRAEVDAKTATAAVGAAVSEIRASYGGIRYMIKRGYGRCSPDQVAAIRAEFNGRNGKALQRRYGISRATLYRYLKK